MYDPVDAGALAVFICFLNVFVAAVVGGIDLSGVDALLVVLLGMSSPPWNALYQSDWW